MPGKATLTADFDSTTAIKKATTTRKRRMATSPGKTGVVLRCLGSAKKRGRGEGMSTPHLIEQVRAGLAYSELEDLQASLALPMDRLAAQVGLSRATLQRRKKSKGPLSAIQSDRVVRLARLMGRAIDVLESEENARHWLTSPQHGLGGATPLDYADTEVGAREVENLLGRIEHGVFS